MDIQFTHQTKSGFRDFAAPVKRVQVSAESVVPDTKEDIGRIASVRTQLLLKSKDVTSRGVTVTGEMDSVLLYITEDENSVSFLRLQREFSLEYELGEISADTQAQIHLSVSNTEARVLNPRKVALTVEILGALRCYSREEIPVETRAPEESQVKLHCQHGRQEMTVINGVCEKSFVLNEQYPFPEEKPRPVQLISQSMDFAVEELQQVGSRVVVKGTFYADVCYFTENRNEPVRVRFSSPFSQIVDTGAEECDAGTALVEVTGAYFDLVDTISGEKALDVEVHAVLQLISRCRMEIDCILDAYSNRFPASCSLQPLELTRVCGESVQRLSGDEELSLAEDCADVVTVLPAITQIALQEEVPTVSVGLDILYRRQSGELSAVRRQMELKEDRPIPGAVPGAGRILSSDFRQEGSKLRCRLSVELEMERIETQNVNCVTAVTVLEETPFASEEWPTVTLVRSGTESLWELARRYHSSVEAIQSANADTSGNGVLLIPRET